MWRALLMWMTAVGLLLGGTFCCSADAPKGKPAAGGATPAEVFLRYDKALHSGDRETLALCCLLYDIASPKDAEQFADILLMENVVEPLIIAGVKKYGVKDFSDALRGTGELLFGMACSTPPAEIYVKHGKLKITGDHAVYSYEVKKSGEDILPVQPQLHAFMKDFWGATDGMSVNFTRSHGRWYFGTPEMMKELSVGQKLLLAWREYCVQVKQNIQTSDDAKAFKAAMTKANDKLNAALNPKKK